MFFRQLYGSLDCEFPASKFWHKLCWDTPEAEGCGFHALGFWGVWFRVSYCVEVVCFVGLHFSWRRKRVGLLVVVRRNPTSRGAYAFLLGEGSHA